MAFQKANLLEIINQISAYYSAPTPYASWYAGGPSYEEITSTGGSADSETDPGAGAIGDVVRSAGMLDLVRDSIYGKVGGAVAASDIASVADKAGVTNEIIIQQSSADDDSVFGTYGVFPEGPMHEHSKTINCEAMRGIKVPVPIYNIVSTQCAFSKKNGDPQALTIFLNAIPTVEWSRCVPYLDVQFLIPQANKAGQTVGSPNIYRFLMGDDKLSAARVNGTGPASSTIDLMLDPAAEETAVTGDEDTSTWAESAQSLRGDASMEVFLSPQTMVNANERTDNINRIGGFKDGTGTTGVLDPFRPFMSLGGMSITIAPHTNEIIFAEGTLSLTVHDRSRLGEIAAIVTPGQFGRMSLLIEYGWSHPDSDNPFGNFLNTLRTRAHYAVSMASYSFTPAGEVNVQLTIQTRGTVQILTDVGILNDLILDEQLLIEKLVRIMTDVAEQLPDAKAKNNPVKTRPKKFLSATQSTGATHLVSLSDKEVTEINDFIDELQVSKDPTLENAGKVLDSFFGAGDTAASWLQGKSGAGTNALAEKIQMLKTLPDPWLVSEKYTGMMGDDGATQLSIEAGEYLKHGPKMITSLAKLINIFVASPLGMDKRFSEIQLIWGPINAEASFAACVNLAAFPIRIADFEAGMKRITKHTGPNITLALFIEFINNYFVNNQMNSVYGFQMGGWNKVKYDKNTGLMNTPTMSGRAAKKYSNHEGGVLVKAYGPAGGAFAQPMVVMSIEACPVDSTGDAATTTAGSGAEALKSSTILRLFFVDEKAKANPGGADLLKRVFESKLPDELALRPVPLAKNFADATEAYNKDMAQIYKSAEEMGILAVGDKSGILRFAGAHHWKKLLKDSVPYVDIGSNFSAVTDCSVQNQEAGALRDLMMLNAEDPSAVGVDPGRAMLPMAMMPQQLDVNIFGCPIVQPFHEIFFDFRTGTDIDTVYNVNTVTHELSPGSFKTSMTCLAGDGYGDFMPMTRGLKNLTDWVADHGIGVKIGSHADVLNNQEMNEQLQGHYKAVQRGFHHDWKHDTIQTFKGIGVDVNSTLQIARVAHLDYKAIDTADEAGVASANLIEAYSLTPKDILAKKGDPGYYLTYVNDLAEDVLQLQKRLDSLIALGTADVVLTEARLGVVKTALSDLSNGIKKTLDVIGFYEHAESGQGQMLNFESKFDVLAKFYKDERGLDIFSP